jgi:hypothetical protein
MNHLKTLALSTLVAGALFAQQQSATAQVVLGAKLGATFSNIDQDPDAFDTNSLTSFGGGAFIRFGIGGLSLQTELLAVTKGTKLGDPNPDEDLKVKLDYIEVPLLLRFGMSSGTGFMPYVMAGPSVGFEIGCELDLEDSDLEEDCDTAGVGFFERAKTDFGLTGALGFELPAGPGNILVEGRYTLGLTDLNKEGDSKSRNRSFGVFAGYAVPLGSR